MPGKTALIADDDPTAVALMSAALAKVGIQAVVARDAMQAVMGAHKTTPDIILMDVNMPGGTGLNALQKIKSSSRTQLIPVIVVSGVDDATLPRKVSDLGAIDFIKKPVKSDDLQKKVCAALGLPAPGTEGKT
jgi:DNA-binding response OmpR family regulator